MIIEVNDDAPLAWRDLIEGLALLSKGQANDISPVHFEHGSMYVCADPSHFSEEEIVKLDELGFFRSEDCFQSFRFGNA